MPAARGCGWTRVAAVRPRGMSKRSLPSARLAGDWGAGGQVGEELMRLAR
jgi:hypothetical protein